MRLPRTLTRKRSMLLRSNHLIYEWLPGGVGGRPNVPAAYHIDQSIVLFLCYKTAFRAFPALLANCNFNNLSAFRYGAGFKSTPRNQKIQEVTSNCPEQRGTIGNVKGRRARGPFHFPFLSAPVYSNPELRTTFLVVRGRRTAA